MRECVRVCVVSVCACVCVCVHACVCVCVSEECFTVGLSSKKVKRVKKVSRTCARRLVIQESKARKESKPHVCTQACHPRK